MPPYDAFAHKSALFLSCHNARALSSSNELVKPQAVSHSVPCIAQLRFSGGCKARHDGVARSLISQHC